MSTIHLEPASLYFTAQRLQQESSYLADYVFRLRVEYYRLKMAWQGETAQEYLSELDVLLRRMEQYIEELLTLSLRLVRHAEAWEESDQRWAAAYRER